MNFLLFLLIVLDEYLNLYYCTWEISRCCTKRILNGCLERRLEWERDEVWDGREKGEKQYSTSGSAIVWFLLFNGNKFLFHLPHETKHCALWFISKKQLIIKCLLWWILRISLSWNFQSSAKRSKIRLFFTRKLIIEMANSFALWAASALFP